MRSRQRGEVDIVNVNGSRPALRWLVPAAAAAVVIGGGAAAGTLVASADPALPDRSAAQLLVDLQTARPAGFSGSVVETADLGLPPLTGLTGGQGEADLSKLVSGSNTARVWYAGQDKVRLALLGTLGETDVVRNGTDVWIWRSAGNTANHVKLPANAAEPRTGALPGMPSTPQEAANAALAAIDPTTSVTTTGSAKVAGRDAYELVLAPKDTASLVGQVRLAIDAKEHIPLRVDVYAKGANDPAFRVAFQQISFAVPDDEQFRFNPPPDAKVTTEQPSAADRAQITAKEKAALAEKRAEIAQKRAEIAKQRAKHQDGAPTVVGSGWTSIVVAKAPSGGGNGSQAQALTGVLNSLPKVSGSWGSGRLLQSKLFTVLVTDDGRVLAGAVTPDRLYAAAAK
jgi:outer membrane lipoprotein-sorting protein